MARAAGKKKISKTQILAWISYGFALVAAAVLPATFLGHGIAWCIAHMWGWLGAACILGGVAAVAVDIFVDLTPNRLAVWITMLLPSIASGMGDNSKQATLAGNIRSLSDALLGLVKQGLGEWIGTTSVVGLAIGSALSAWIIARRTMPARGGAA